jgi:hypothetical protein
MSDGMVQMHRLQTWDRLTFVCVAARDCLSKAKHPVVIMPVFPIVSMAWKAAEADEILVVSV